MKVILQLMKASRQKRLMEFFEWVAKGEVEVTLLLREDLFRRCLLYAVHIDINLDVEGIARTLSSSNELQTEAMSLAQKLRNEGRVEGRQEGRAEGMWSGKIQLLEQLMGLKPTNSSELAEMNVVALEAHFHELEQRYNLSFKK
jgi:hypothetical protein